MGVVTAAVIPFGRVLREGSIGPDVLGMKRALARAGHPKKVKLTTLTDTFGEFTVTHLDAFRKEHGLARTHIYDRGSHAKLAPFFDNVAADLYADWNPALAKARAMLAFCREFDGPYVYGGEHDLSFSDDDPDDGFDCSSSTSYMLHHFGLLGSEYAHTSSWFETWGARSRGRYVTIHATHDHVWTEFDLPEGYFRFDTSPWGDGPHGPRVRTRRRPDARFVHRHYPLL